LVAAYFFGQPCPISSYLCSSQRFVTLPLASATAERSFSTTRRLNSHLKSTIGESCLYGLAQMSIDHDLPIDPEKVVDELAKKKRRLNFIVHNLTNLRLTADGFSLCMPTIIT